MKTKTIDKLLELVNSISSFYERCKVKDGNQYDFKIAETAIEIDGILKEEKERRAREKMFLPKNTKMFLKETERLLNPKKKPLDLMLDSIEFIEEIKELKKEAMRKENDNLREELKTYQDLTKLVADENEKLKKEKDESRLLNKSLAKDVDNLTEINKSLTHENTCLYKRLHFYFESYSELRRQKSKKKIDIFNPSNWFIKDEEIEDKIKEAKNQYDRLINETPIKRLSINQIRDYVNKNYFGKF